jgi:hypothetical protein
MARFIKHVGKIGDRKVAVIFREIPGEEWMCLVVYTELLNQNIHDPLIACIESEPAQAAMNLADALNKNYTRDGKILLQVLHGEGMMKKVQTSQVLMTPAPNQSVRLDELNKILNEMAQGEEAVKKLAEMDASRGLQDPKDIARRMREQQPTWDAAKAAVDAANNPQRAPVQAASPDVYGDNDLARQRLTQAQRMAAEARGLLAESQRLEQEAFSMDPSLAPAAPAPAAKAKRAKAEKAVTPESILAEMSAAPKKAGRPRKTTVTG